MAVNQHEVDSLAVTLIIILAKWAFEAIKVIKDNFIPNFYDLVRYVNLSIKHIIIHKERLKGIIRLAFPAMQKLQAIRRKKKTQILYQFVKIFLLIFGKED